MFVFTQMLTVWLGTIQTYNIIKYASAVNQTSLQNFINSLDDMCLPFPLHQL